MTRSSGIAPTREADHTVAGNAAVFIGFVASGCAYIILAKLWGVGQFYVTFVPVAVMIGYAVLIALARGLRLRDDQSGDNLYYMGFLFTLTSLGVSLYQFSAARASEEIVQNFGIAIASTITGIGLRVVFNQMRRDPVEIERMMRLELAEAARRVRRELDASVVEFGYFRRTAQQSVADSFGVMTERFDEVVAKLLASLEVVSARLASPVDAASGQLGDATGEVSKTIGSIAAALDGVAGKLNSIQTPQRVIELQLDPIAQSLARAVDRMTAQSDAQARVVKDALAAASGQLGATGEMSKTIGSIATALERVAGKLNSIQAPQRVIELQLDPIAQSLARAVDRMTAQSDAQARVVKDALATASGQLGATGEMSKTIGSIATALDRVAGKLNSIQAPQRVIELQLDPIAQSLAQAVDRMTVQSDAQARAVKDALAIANTETGRSIDLVSALRQEYNATSAANRAALEAAAAMIRSTAEVLDEIKASSQAYAESLAAMLEQTDGTMRTFTEVLIKAGVDADIRTERLSEALPAIEGHARALAQAAERISGTVGTRRGRQVRRERETID